MPHVEFVPSYPIASLAPADYNPRKISEESFAELKQSLLRFGVVKPLIVNKNNGILVAGHQRTKAMKAVGITEAPVILIKSPTVHDEIKFNLFHNSIETGKTPVNAGDIPPWYSYIKAKDVRFTKNLNATVVTEIGRLYAAYGPWGSVVVGRDGVVLANSDYAVAMRLFGEDILAFRIKDEDEEEFCRMNGLDYGEYHYDALGVKAYNQHLCHMTRLSRDSVKRLNRSTLYEGLVIPHLQKHHRAVDFGAGKCAYPRELNKTGFNVSAYEPHLRKEGTHAIDVAGVVRQIEGLEREVRKGGLFDVVILDSVLNSVTTPEFEHMVLTTCNALCNQEATFFAHCRDISRIDDHTKAKENTQKTRSIEFFDKNNFSVTFRNGVFTMQHFHTMEGLQALLERYFAKVLVKKLSNVSLSATCSQPRALSAADYESALAVEFNMEYPGEYRHNKHLPLVKEILARVESRNSIH